MKVAICMRGKCLDDNLDCKSGIVKKVDYKKSLQNIFDNLINCNKNYKFDFYLHGWINNEDDIQNIVNDFKPKSYILEKQRDFTDDYKHISNHNNILCERYKHIYPKKKYYNIGFMGYFNSVFSYAYSISKSIELMKQSKIKYDIVISMRYDIIFKDKFVFPSDINNVLYVDYAVGHGPLYYGDFFALSSMKIMSKYDMFYQFMKTNVFNNDEFEMFHKNYLNLKHIYKSSRFDHGRYSNQMIYPWFLSKNDICYNKVNTVNGIHINKSDDTKHKLTYHLPTLSHK